MENSQIMMPTRVVISTVTRERYLGIDYTARREKITYTCVTAPELISLERVRTYFNEAIQYETRTQLIHQ